MPQGIVISSGSTGSKTEDTEALLKKHGYEEVRTYEEGEEPAEEGTKTEEEKAAEAADLKAQEEEKEFIEATEEKKPSKFQRRIEKILEKATAPLKAKIADLESKNGKTVELAAKEEAAPKREDFNSYEEFEEARFQYRYKAERAKETAAEAQEHEKELLKGFLEAYEEDKERAIEEHEDFSEVVKASKVVIHPAVQMAIYECRKPAEIVYYLAKNPDYAGKLAEMTPLSAVKEVGRLEDKLAKAPGKVESTADGGVPRKPKPQLPAPIRSVSTAATTSTLTSRDAAEKGDFPAFKVARKAGR